MPASERSAEEKKAALTIYAEHGLAETHRQTGIPKATLHDWARAGGLDVAAIAGEHTARTLAASSQRSARCEARRLELREQLLETASSLLDRIEHPHIEYRGQHATQVEYPVPPADACKHYVTAAAICIDKYRLEVGEATERVEVGGEEIAESRSLRDELAQRRERLAS